MKTLDPNDLRCCFCGEAIKSNDVVAIVDTPTKHLAAAHTHHSGVRDHLIRDASQITTGSLLHHIAKSIREGQDSETAWATWLN